MRNWDYRNKYFLGKNYTAAAHKTRYVNLIITGFLHTYSRRQKKVVIPAKAGIQHLLYFWDSHFCGNDIEHYDINYFMMFTILY